VKTLARLLPLLAFLGLILALRLAGCQIRPVPSGSQATSGSEASGQLTAAPTASPVASRSGRPTATPTPRPTPTQKPSPTPSPTAKPSPTSLPAASPTPMAWSSKKLGWYYVPASAAGSGDPATIPADIRSLIAPFAVLWQSPQPQRRVVYLTMDEGYEYAANTSKILDTAKLKGIPITFFITGSFLDKNPDLVGRMLDEGHLVANHTDSHPNLADLLEKGGRQAVQAELDRLASRFRQATGQTLPRLVRPPEGSYSQALLAALDEAGYRTVFWSFAYRDWLTDDQPDPEAAKEKILGQLHNGSILLLHAVSVTNVEILPELIDAIENRGYEFARLDEIP
jgi:peptidoglycan-N-acetylmuramic acid deacetylase